MPNPKPYILDDLPTGSDARGFDAGHAVVYFLINTYIFLSWKRPDRACPEPVEGFPKPL
jgi:hypothetical protein